MRTSLLILLFALLSFSTTAQNARPVLADTNGVIRVGTVGSELTSLNASQLSTGTVPMGRLALGSTNSTAGMSGGSYWTDGTNRWTSRDGQALTNLQSANLSGTLSSNVLPGLLSGLSVGNGQGVVTNTKSPEVWIVTNLTSSALVTNYTIPTWARFLYIEAQAGGGGGGSGGKYTNGVVACGGGGGGGGGYAAIEHRTDKLLSITNVLYVSVGRVGTGGASQTTNSTAGLNGSSGGATYVATDSSGTNLLCNALGGANGSGGTSSAGAGGSAGSAGLYAAGNGASANTSGLVGVAGTAIASGLAGPGGGSGGGVSSGDVASNGGQGGYGPGAIHGIVRPAAGTAGGGDGDTFASVSLTNLVWASPGGSGGGSSVTGNAGAGGRSLFGGGGGGGGAARDGIGNSGAGGNGGGGFVRITAY